MRTFKLFSQLVTVIGMIMVFAISGWGDTSNNDSCANAELNATFANLSTATAGTIRGSLTTSSDQQDYYKITIASAGTLEINATSTDNTDFSIGSSCGTTCGTQFYTNGNAQISTHKSGVFSVSAGDTVYFKISRNKTLTYNISIQYLPPVRVGFQNIIYQTSENTALPYGQTSSMPMNIILDRPVNFDVNVTYNTVDGTAIGDHDYRIAGGTITIPAGQTSYTINMDIVHEEEIELDENFTVVLSNPSPAGPVILSTTNSVATVTILGQTIAPLCYNDTFNSTVLDGTWRTLKSSGSFSPQIVNNRLRLTPAVGNMATAITKDYQFPTAQNIITVEFTHYAYSGSGADGFALVLYNTVVGANPTPGAFGGSLGYAQKSNPGSDCTVPGGCPGFQGGWLGLGLDEYGNYQNPTEGRIGGPGFIPNSVAIRGDGSGQTGYEFLQGTSTLNPVLWNNGSTPYPGDKFRMTVDARDSAHLYITLERDTTGTGNNYNVIVNKFDAKLPAYNQSTTPDYVRLALTASTGGSNAIHEIDDISVWGRCVPYSPSPSTPPANIGAVDVVDNFLTNGYVPRTGLKTKITSKTDNTHFLDAVWLGTAGGSSAIPYYTAGNNNVVNMPVLFYVSDINATNDNGSCTVERYQMMGSNGQPLVATFTAGATYARTTSTYTVQSQANQYSKIVPKYINFYGMNLIDPSITCLVNSSNNGNIAGMPQCVNSPSQYLQAFGQTAVDRCRGTLNGVPCDPNNHGVGTGAYANSYGCYQCTLDALATKGCSSDAFAIRPDRFAISSSSSHWPDLLTSAADYNVTVEGLTYQGSNAYDYNVTSARSILELNTTARYYPNNTIDASGQLVGVYSIGANDFNISNGFSVRSDTVSTDVVPINFSDVGKMGLQVIDKIWAAVDNDDTSLNCSGTYICGDVNATFIPLDFNISTATVTNNNGNPGSFTYMIRQGDPLSTLQKMSGRFNLNISALNNNNAVTQNFRSGAWENPLSVTASVFDTVMGDANETSITNVLLGFGTGTDANGTKTLSWNEGNTSKMLRFNYNMSPNVPINPFRIDGNETNISIASIYTGTAAILDRNITGSRVQNADGNATFVYGRIIPKDIRVFGSVAPVAYAWYEVYNAPIIAGVTLAPSKNESLWYSNTLHNDTTDGDANVTRLQQGTTSTGTNYFSSSIGSGIETYTFTAQTPPYNAKAHIDTDSWLWYGVNASTYADPSATNLDCMTHPCFNINVVPAIGATGSANTAVKNTKDNKKSSSGGGIWQSTSDYAPAIR